MTMSVLECRSPIASLFNWICIQHVGHEIACCMGLLASAEPDIKSDVQCNFATLY